MGTSITVNLWLSVPGHLNITRMVGDATFLRDQLIHFDRLVTLHESFWRTLSQWYPSHRLYVFMEQRWFPWLRWWRASRPYLDTDQGILLLRDALTHYRDHGGLDLSHSPVELLVSIVREAAQGLSSLRESAVREGIFAPDLGTSRYGFAETSVSGFFDDLVSAAKSVYGAAKGAVSSVASFVHHPPGWLAVAMPLFTQENQRYWAEKLGGSTGTKLYDAGVKLVAEKALGPQGPQLVEAYNKIVEDAAQGHVDAQQILTRAPQIAKLATASRRGPEAFRAAVAETRSAVKVSGLASRPRHDRRS